MNAICEIGHCKSFRVSRWEKNSRNKFYGKCKRVRAPDEENKINYIFISCSSSFMRPYEWKRWTSFMLVFGFWTRALRKCFFSAGRMMMRNNVPAIWCACVCVCLLACVWLNGECIERMMNTGVCVEKTKAKWNKWNEWMKMSRAYSDGRTRNFILLRTYCSMPAKTKGEWRKIK